jgi:phage shock protein A
MTACENHEALTQRCAATEARVDSMEDWVEKLEDKIDELQRTLNDINQQISRVYGMARLAAWLVGLAGTGATVWKILAG